MSGCRSRGCKFESQLGHITFMESSWNNFYSHTDLHIFGSPMILPYKLNIYNLMDECHTWDIGFMSQEGWLHTIGRSVGPILCSPVLCPYILDTIWQLVIKSHIFLQIHWFIVKAFCFLCPHLPKAGVGHIAFRRDVTSVRAYVRMSRS